MLKCIKEIYTNLVSICEISRSLKQENSFDEIFRMDEDPPLPTESVFKHVKDSFSNEWSEELFGMKVTIPDFSPPYFINAPIFLNGDLPPKKRHLLSEEDMR